MKTALGLVEPVFGLCILAAAMIVMGIFTGALWLARKTPRIVSSAFTPRRTA